MPTYIYTGCYTDWVQILVTTISCHLGQSNGSLTYAFAGAVTVGVHNEGRYIYSPSLNDKDDKNDKESEKSPMRVIGRGLWKPCHCCHSCHSCHGRCGDRAALCSTALTFDGGSGDHEGSQPLASSGLCCHGLVHSLVTSAQCQIALWCEGVCPAPCTNLHIAHRDLPQKTSGMGNRNNDAVIWIKQS